MYVSYFMDISNFLELHIKHIRLVLVLFQFAEAALE